MADQFALPTWQIKLAEAKAALERVQQLVQEYAHAEAIPRQLVVDAVPELPLDATRIMHTQLVKAFGAEAVYGGLIRVCQARRKGI